MFTSNYNKWLLLIMILVSLILNWPYLNSGFTGDEITLIHALKKDPLPFSRWKGAWSGDPGDFSLLGNPWWADPGAMGSFFRPLPSLVIEGSLKIFGQHAFPLHLISILMHGSIGYLVFLILIKLTQSKLVPLLSGFIYIICEDHSMTVGFISFITDIMCVFFICLSLLFHLIWLKSRNRKNLVLSIVFLVVAFGCKETAAIGPLAIMFTSFMFPNGVAGSLSNWNVSTVKSQFKIFLQNKFTWLPALLLLLLYLGAYQAFALGGMNNLSYVDPLQNPLRYCKHLVVHLPVMWLAAFSPVFPSLGLFDPGIYPVLAFAGLIVLVLFLWALKPHRNDPVVIWAFILFLISLLPQLGTDAGERLLYFPFIFVSVLIAIMVQDIRFLSRRFLPDAPLKPVVTRIMGWYLLISCVAAGLAFSIMMPFTYPQSVAWFIDDPLTAKPFLTGSTEHVIVLNSRNQFSLLTVTAIFEQLADRSLDVHVLSANHAKVSITRSGNSSFTLTMDRTGWLTNFLSGAFRNNPILDPNRIYVTPLFDVSLTKVTDDKRDLLSARFEMNKSFHDPHMLFLFWNGKSFQRIDLEELQIGKKITLN